MASQQELAQSAMQHALKTQWTWYEYLQEIRLNPKYNYRATEWYKAGADLQAGKTADSPNPPQESDPLDSARARIFLADNPMLCINAPNWMVPVCTSDWTYRHFYTPDVIHSLRRHFGKVEAWADCRNPTPYQQALDMVRDLRLDGAWGQCETTQEFDNAYNAGARRLVGNINSSVLDEARLNRIKSGEVLVSVELYRNKQPNLQPDWRGANAGIGGNCIACYASSSEGAVYTPVKAYIDAGLYVPHHDSVYGVGLKLEDWHALGGV